MDINMICSNRPRPSVHSNRSSHGNQHWTRDVFHAAGIAGKTLCGVNADGWLAIETKTAAEVMYNQHFCRRCWSQVNKLLPF